MKNALLLLAAPFFLLGIYLLALPGKQPLPVVVREKNNIISCSPYYTPDNMDTAENGKFIIPLPGWGQYTYSISSGSDSAGFYFNQGLNMYYSYHMKEAVASFKEAARFDPGCPMVYWGQALAMGPDYNHAYVYSVPKGVPAVLQLMNQTSSQATPKEKKLIEVMNRRYSADSSDGQRAILNQSYARGLKELCSSYPEDLDIKAFYIDAMMLIHPWDFWNNDGSAKEWTPELVDICENILRINPNHPAALHYHIHLTEASRHPEVALADAGVLKDLMPGVAHMVHMSSHEYERNGLYALGVQVNDKADDDLMHYVSLAKNIFLNSHYSHYFAVQAFCALGGGMYQTGMRDALRCRNSVSPTYENTHDQYLYMMPVLTLVRLGKWEEILQDSIGPGAHWPYARVLYNFARGLAFVYTGHRDSASNNLFQLRRLLHDSILTIRDIPFNAPLPEAGIAEEILNAAILFTQKKYDSAISCLNNAIRTEDNLIYMEPKAWPIPARQFLGAYLLKLGRADQAEKVYREDLIWNPGNGWSLLGLYQSLRAQEKTKYLDEYRSKYLRCFSQAERIPPASAFLE